MSKYKITKLHYVVVGVSLTVFASVSFARLIGFSLTGKQEQLIVSRINAPDSVLGSGPEVYGEDDSAEQAVMLPSDFPADFPVFPGSSLENTWTSTASGSLGVSAVWFIERVMVNIVSTYFEDELHKFNWDTQTVLKENGSTTITFGKETVNGYLGITSEGDGVVISSVLEIDND